MQKRLMLVYEGSLYPRKAATYKRPHLKEAIHYKIVSEPTLAVLRAHVSVA